MGNNSGRNLFLIVLGYYLFTGSKTARNFLIGMVVAFVIGWIVAFFILFKDNFRSKEDEAQRMELLQAQNEQDYQEGLEYAAEVLPAFVKRFKGKTLKGKFNEFSTIDSYAIKIKILNDSLLSYQIAESDDETGYYSDREKWGKSKKTSYSLVPSVRGDGMVIKDQLVFQFEQFKGELQVMESKKKKKFQIFSPPTLTDADNLTAILSEW